MGDARIFTCNLCEALCGLSVELEGARVTQIRGNPDDVFSRGHVCPKAHGLGELLADPDRLRAPVRRSERGWEKVEWEVALSDVAARLRAVRARHGKDAVALYIGNPVVHSHRSSFAAELLTLALHTKNRFDPNSQDGNPRLYACMQVYGDALSIPVPDIDRTAYLLILGGNPAASNGSMMALGDVRARLRGVRARGGRVVLVDPRRTETAAFADRHHFIRTGGDAALLLSVLQVLFAEGRVALGRIEEVASGLAELRGLAERFPPSRVAAAIGMSVETIVTLARELSLAPSACVYARAGVCQSAFGPLASWLVEALNVVTGNFDREGGAMFPSPPADVAPLGRLFVGNHTGRWRSRVRGLPEFLGALPSAVMAEEMETPGEGQVRALVCLAGNPVLSTPNGERLGRAIAKLDLVVAIDFYVNETSRFAHYVLPSKHVFETGNFDLLLSRFAVRNVAKYSPPIVEAGDDTKDDWDVATEIALRLSGMPLGFVARALRSLPERLIDLLLLAGKERLTLKKLAATPNGRDLGPLLPQRLDRVRTPDRKARLAPPELVADIPRLEAWLDAAPPPLVLVGRRHLRSNNSWMHNLPSLAKGKDRAELLMHPSDATARGLVDGARVRITSRTGAVVARLALTEDVMPGAVSLPHGFGHAAAQDTLRVAGKLAGPNANAITDDLLVEPVVGTSILNGVPVEVEHAP